MDRDTRERICMLVDELLRRGVPEDVVSGVLRWLDAESWWVAKDLRHKGGEVKGIRGSGGPRSGKVGAKGN